MAISPTVRRRILARKLRELREQAGLTQTETARSLDWKQSKISRIEDCQQGVRVSDLLAMLTIYGADTATREMLTNLAREASRKGWWHSYADALPSWFETYVGLEAEADTIRTYEVDVVPGLLQTEAYARADTRATVLDETEENLEQRVELRLQRQRRLYDDSPFTLWAVIGEAAIRRPVGGHHVMREQLHHIAKLVESSDVTVQIMPLEAGEHPATGAFTILGFPRSEHPEVVYLESQVGGHYLEEPQQVTRYSRVMDHLRAHALDPAESLRVLQTRADERAEHAGSPMA
ncbi:XRE family transcriptional regulator [Actinopolyspora erythraea]|uniref:XRE family transcriptional regulator n=1 Tax=Actinopolyspora erythraea TaxID=414996 RepID=A0A099D141_9ACTN|nr:helix-turn-helix transcriptional regulator [Actinopolyspora erythraea]ASU77722.1 XRE family transcriptional regulator [Actinopolyspora erythraea]KGI79928.1 XRE family transcriptional regulator [Actinopolyspora erythraea]